MLRDAPTFVYFIRQTNGEGPVKIGCSYRPVERLRTHMTWGPYPLEIVATIPGDEQVERRFHALFIEQHSHLEWFHPSAELDACIEAIVAGTFDVDGLPPPRSLHRQNGNGWTRDHTRRSASLSHRLRLSGRLVPGHVTDAQRRFREGGGQADAEIVEFWLAAVHKAKAA